MDRSHATTLATDPVAAQMHCQACGLGLIEIRVGDESERMTCFICTGCDRSTWQHRGRSVPTGDAPGAIREMWEAIPRLRRRMPVKLGRGETPRRKPGHPTSHHRRESVAVRMIDGYGSVATIRAQNQPEGDVLELAA